jgi:ketosteroid isomerase-like protein
VGSARAVDSYNPAEIETACPAAKRMTPALIARIRNTHRPRPSSKTRRAFATAASRLALLAAAIFAAVGAHAATPASAAAPATSTAPAPLVVPAAVPAASDALARDASADIAGVTDAVRNWAAAWSRKDADAYIAAYVPGFKGGEASAAAWQASRRDRIKGKGRISVEVSNIVVLIGRSQKSATFTQAYSADSLRQQNRKTLEFEQRDGRWLIVREVSVSSSRS